MLRILDFYKFKKQNFETIMHDKHSASVAFCSANINVFFPQIDVKRYSKIILRIFYNNDLAKREKTNLKNLNKIDYSSLKLPYNKGFFLVSFHYGSYHLISSMLIKLNYKTVVCVNETVFQNKKTIEDSLNTFNKFKNEASSESDLVF